MELSIVTTLYNSEEYIEEFVDRIQTTISQIKCSYEIIIVDDGSKDDSVTNLRNIR